MKLDFSQNGFYMIFEIDGEGKVALRHFSTREKEFERNNPKNLRSCRIVDIHVAGEDVDDHHGYKHTGMSRCNTLKYVTHRYFENDFGNKLEFDLADETIAVTVHYQFYKTVAALRAWCIVKNIGDEVLGLEYVTSFAYSGFEEGEGHPNEKINVYIPRNSWAREVNWKKMTLSQAGINFTEQFSFDRVNLYNTGFWSTKEYLPMGAVENTERECLYLWQIEHNGSWQWEIADKSEMLYFKLSGPSGQENSWYKELAPGESFESVKACITLGKDFNAALKALTQYRRRIFKNIPENAANPVIFNDYLHCLWANPTEEKELPLIDVAAELGAEYYVMDAGWYADGEWWDTVGEWMPIDWRFPSGIKYIFDYIRQKGMIPGIWLEFESMGVRCPLAKEMPDECFIMRHGKRVIDHGRYVLDFRNAQARAHCAEAVRRVIEDYGVLYIKNDFNVECGVGTDYDSDSLGDGLLEHNRAFLVWYDEIREKYPHVTFENCASGGMRMDYAMLAHQHIQSLTDQDRYWNTAHIAAAAATAVLPEQAAVWATPIQGWGENSTVMNMINAMMQRMHLSGDAMNWDDATKALAKEGVEVYKATRADINTAIPFYPLGTIPAYDDQWLCTAYRCRDCTRLLIWRLESDDECLTVPTDFAYESVKILYPSNSKCAIERGEGNIRLTLPEKRTAVFVELR
jgi:alpha-galactosidase